MIVVLSLSMTTRLGATEIKRGFHRACLFDGDHAVFADLVHRLRDDSPDRGIVISACRASSL
jgi:hypothetical protein